MVATKNKLSKIENARQMRAFGRIVHNFLSTRARAFEMTRGGLGIDPPGRDLDYECGYPQSPDVSIFRRLYDREAYAKRVNDIWPDESWAVRPELYETEDARVTKFERAWKKLNKEINVWHYLHRADRISGLGCFGVILLGLDDGKMLDQPVDGINRRGEISRKRPKKQTKLVYLKVFSEQSVEIEDIEDDDSNPRYGKPRYYQIQMTSPFSGATSLENQVRVHWTRVIHVADNREECDEAGSPRMLPVLNRLLDIRKILGSSAEMFYKAGFPGYAFETVPEMVGEAVMNEATIKEQFEEYMEGLKRYLALDGVKVNQLIPQVSDPTKHLVQQATAICLAMQIPLRIFLGSEAGHLASTQDLGTWNKRVAERQSLYVEPMLIRPVIDRLIMVGVLPEPADMEYLISWRDLNTMSDKDKADVSLKRAQALMQYVSGGCESIMPARQFYTMVLGLSELEAKAVLDAVKMRKDTLTDPLGDKAAVRDSKLNKVNKVMKPQGGGRVGNPASGRTGRPAGQIQKNRRNRIRRILTKLAA